MPNILSNLVIEVQRRQSQEVDPPLYVFQVNVQTDHGVWPEPCGSVQDLSKLLQGMKILLDAVGIHAGLEWGIPDHWSSPCGKRWTLGEDGLMREESLDEKGNVLHS